MSYYNLCQFTTTDTHMCILYSGKHTDDVNIIVTCIVTRGGSRKKDGVGHVRKFFNHEY